MVSAYTPGQNANRSRSKRHTHTSGGGGTGAASVTGFPNVDKPQPQWNPNWQCPPEGDGNETNPSGGDPQLNKLKNRVDDGSFQAVDFNVISGLPIPAGTHQHRIKWSTSAKNTVANFEGTPISIEGFLAVVNNAKPGQPANNQGAREEGPESCNCHNDTSTFHDFHVWLLPPPGDVSRTNAIVVEITPPVRAKRQNWNLAKLTQIAQNKQKVRISGWLLFDQEHPEQIGKTRATLWEIHPIIKIEVESNGAFTTLN